MAWDNLVVDLMFRTEKGGYVRLEVEFLSIDAEEPVPLLRSHRL